VDTPTKFFLSIHVQAAVNICKSIAAFVVLTVALCFCWSATPAGAQSAGEGALQGTVTDSSGAVLPNATVVATNVATGIAATRTTTSAGFYVISPLQPGTYSVKVSSSGFQTVEQANVVVNALQMRVYDPVLSVGQETQTVQVTAAPPVLNTADATLGLTVENTTYTNLPLQMTGSQQRDPTAFGTLTPGSQTGVRLPIIGGTGNYLGQLYLEGMPAQTVNQQGDNRVVSLSMSVEAVDQFQVLTSTPPAEYMGAGAMNFTMKSGGLKYHGKVADYIRNTIFDSWSFTAKAATIKNAAGQTIPAPKPVEHQNELSLSFGGVVPKTAHKLFFFVAYDKYHYRFGANPSLFTIPSKAMIAGDFTELNGNVGAGGRTGTGSDNPPILFDPTTNSCVGSVCTRQPLVGVKNGVATNNVIPSAMISPIAKAMASFMPEPTNPNTLSNNFLAGSPGGRDNHLTDWRVDYEISSKQHLSSIGAMGAVHYLNNFQSGGTAPNSYGYLPLPYVGGTYADIFPKDYVVEHTYTISPTLVNQFKYSYTRFIQPQRNATDGIKEYAPSAFGISNLPAGQASTEFPGATFGATAAYSTPLTGWTMNSTAATTQSVVPNNYALTDNVQWVKGKHSFTFGFTHQWEEINTAAPVGFSAQAFLAYNAFSTANFAANSNALSTGSASAPSGFAFASYMLGAVAGSNSGVGSAPTLPLFPLSETGGRYHTFSPYFRDNYKLTQKLTLELGLRWDYLPPFHEVQDRWTFLNPNLTNPLTGTPGLLQFAGDHGGAGVSCNCRTPVQTYWKNFGPRVGFAYELNQKTVIRAGFATVYSQAGGVGGRGGNASGTGNTGFNMTATGPTESGSGAGAGPSYWLNNSATYTSKGIANTGLFGPGFVYPSAPTPNVAAQTLNTGFYVSGGKVVSAGSVNYADPYFSGRAPEIVLYNFGIERSITPDVTLAINYAGNESHFIVNSGTTGGAARGYWANQLNPKYLAVLGSVKDSTGTKPILTAPATPANAAIVTANAGDAPIPPFFTAAGSLSSSATVAQMLTHFPQYGGVGDTWGNVGNFSYNSLQITVNQRMHNGLTYNVNYTYAKNLGDDGTYRTGFDLPANSISHGTTAYKQNRIDRSYTAISVPHTIHAYGVYKLPFGKNQIGSNSTLVRWLAGGWQFSGIYTYSSGTPVAATLSGLTTTASGNFPLQGQAMPDLNTSFSGPARINGKFGSGPNGTLASNLGKVQYIDVNGFAQPQNISTVSGQPQYLIGNAPRNYAYQMRNPYTWNVDAGMRRSFPLHESLEFTFEADCVNVWNHVTFSSPSASWAAGSTAFGTIGGISNTPGPRDWQFAGHITF
jgi:hypothetical protein